MFWLCILKQRHSVHATFTFVDAGANKDLVSTDKGETPEEAARRMGHDEVADFVRDWDAEASLKAAADYLGVHLKKEEFLKWLVKEFLDAPLPEGWMELESEEG